MSYHHNGFGNGGGGFGRSNNGFRSSGYSNQGYGSSSGAYGSNSNSGYHQNGPRINETQVPQSKHTIFIRGLSGDITTEEIQDFIGQKVGKISFDFVKVALDRSKIFVAVRFEKRDEAKEFMETYSDREFMGCRCELSWFRDIRRYCAYQRAKQIRSNSQRRRRRSDSDDNDQRGSPSPVRKSTSRASRSRSRSVKRSHSRNSRNGSSVSKSPEGRKGRSQRRETSSRSGSSEGSVSSSRESRRSRTSSGEEAESRTSSRRSSRRSGSRQESNGSKRRRESESQPKESKKVVVPQIPLPPKEATPLKAPPTAVESPPTNPYQEYQQQIQLQQVVYSVPMEEEAPPRVLVREEVVEEICYTAPTPTTPIAPTAPSFVQPPPTTTTPRPPPPSIAPAPKSPSPVVTPATTFVPRQVGRIEIVMPASLPAAQAPPTFAPSTASIHGVSPAAALSANSPSKMASMPAGTVADGQDAVKFPATNKLFGHLKAFQSALLSTVRYEPPTKKSEDGDEGSSLRLSSMETSEESDEELKALEREQKLARLTEDQMMRFHIKKKQLETNFRNDCDTYAVVTRALLSKDESLQFGLKIALLENMDDLYSKMMQRVDDHLNAILA